MKQETSVVKTNKDVKINAIWALAVVAIFATIALAWGLEGFKWILSGIVGVVMLLIGLIVLWSMD
jgi:hypothetical protein